MSRAPIARKGTKVGSPVAVVVPSHKRWASNGSDEKVAPTSKRIST